MPYKIDHPESPRVETGAIQFGNDWPGYFLRGDDAFGLALNIKSLRDQFLVIPKELRMTEAWLALMSLTGHAREIIDTVVVGHRPEVDFTI